MYVCICIYIYIYITLAGHARSRERQRQQTASGNRCSRLWEKTLEGTERDTEGVRRKWFQENINFK